MKLLIIEDDKQTVATLKNELKKDYIIEPSFSASDGEYRAEMNGYDLIILDLSLPDKNGFEVCRSLRKKNIRTPILVLTGEGDTSTMVKLFEAGADDYLTKPYKFEELKVRIKALLRRHYLPTSNTLSFEDLSLDLDSRIAIRGVRKISLRRKEFYLLEYLLRNSRKVVTRDMILDHVWKSDSEALTNIVDVHIKYLRDQIDKPFSKKLIKTVHGIGYKLES